MADGLSRNERIVARWQAAYDEWERGENYSPSIHDLVFYAHEIDPTIPDSDSPEGDALADRLFDVFCDGAELTEMVELLP